MLVYPPSRSQIHERCPAALTMLAAVLEQAGCEVHLLDANAVARRRDRAAIVEEARRLRPDVIGISMVTPLVSESYRLAADLHGLGARLLAGGPHATLLPEEPILHGFDAVVVGEGEPAVAEAIDALLGRMQKAAAARWVYRDDSGKPVRTAPRPPPDNLDALPPLRATSSTLPTTASPTTANSTPTSSPRAAPRRQARTPRTACPGTAFASVRPPAWSRRWPTSEPGTGRSTFTSWTTR